MGKSVVEELKRLMVEKGGLTSEKAEEEIKKRQEDGKIMKELWG